MTKHKLQWRDLVEDGRNVIDDDQHPPVTIAADRRRPGLMINVKVAEVVHAIEDERQQPRKR